jgi:hypothetical protein
MSASLSLGEVILVSSAILPEILNLAWAPAVGVDEVEMHDRHNGVPTLGVFRIGTDHHLFWRVSGYIGDFSLWLYVPLTPDEVPSADEDPSILEGIVYGLETPRYATIGLAEFNRIIFEREWQIPPALDEANLLRIFLTFVNEALKTAIETDLPATRKQAVRRASDAVKQLVPC